MDTDRFDRMSKRFAGWRGSRRAAAQAATPEATPGAKILPSGEDAGEKTYYLFVQSFRSGSVAAKGGEPGTYTVTLEGGLGQTVYFADRPARDVGALPTPDFLAALGFDQGNLPNAALVLETAPGEMDIAAIELGNPTYETATHTATYDVRVLQNWTETTGNGGNGGGGFAEASDDLTAVASSFGAAHLFIDDCASLGIECVPASGERGWGFVGISHCWTGTACAPCAPEPVGDIAAANELWRTRCNRNLPGLCKGTCDAVWRSGPRWDGA